MQEIRRGVEKEMIRCDTGNRSGTGKDVMICRRLGEV